MFCTHAYMDRQQDFNKGLFKIFGRIRYAEYGVFGFVSLIDKILCRCTWCSTRSYPTLPASTSRSWEAHQSLATRRTTRHLSPPVR